LTKKVTTGRLVGIILKIFQETPDEKRNPNNICDYLKDKEFDISLEQVREAFEHLLRQQWIQEISDKGEYALTDFGKIKKSEIKVRPNVLEIPLDFELYDYDEKTEIARLRLMSLENRLRKFVISKSPKLDSYEVKWEEKREKERQGGRNPKNYDLIYYSDLEELRKIIIDNENWSQRFEKYFGKQESIVSDLIKLEKIFKERVLPHIKGKFKKVFQGEGSESSYEHEILPTYLLVSSLLLFDESVNMAKESRRMMFMTGVMIVLTVAMIVMTAYLVFLTFQLA
jgi:hypothetical protein